MLSIKHSKKATKVARSTNNIETLFWKGKIMLERKNYVRRFGFGFAIGSASVGIIVIFFTLLSPVSPGPEAVYVFKFPTIRFLVGMLFFFGFIGGIMAVAVKVLNEP